MKIQITHYLDTVYDTVRTYELAVLLHEYYDHHWK
jgi:hypothetical protein